MKHKETGGGMSENRNEFIEEQAAEEENKLAFPKGCLWSLALSLPVWAALIYFLFWRR
jgi:hypothetical protein